MNEISSNGGAPRPLFTPLPLEEFDVTWAGASPFQPGFCFGTEDGRVFFTDEEGKRVLGVIKGSETGEAINGVAYSGEWIAISTRAGIMMGTMRPDPEKMHASVGLAFGAHGIVAAPGGYFVAPLGPAGVEMMKAGSRLNDPKMTLPGGKDRMNFYRVVALPGRDGKDLMVYACRQGGVGITEMRWGQQDYIIRVAAGGGLDVVDVCAIGSDSVAPSVAAIGRNGTLILIRDALHDKKPQAKKFGLIQGTAYRIFSTPEHILVLTSRGLYLLTGVSGRFLAGMPLEKISSDFRMIPMEVVDASLIGDRWLVVITANQVLKLDIAKLDHGFPGNQSDGGMQAELAGDLVPDWDIHEVAQTSRRELVGSV